jgi:hypothetical protein
LSIASSSSSSDRDENTEHAKPRQVVRGCGVDLHKFDLIAGEGRVRQDFSDAGKYIPQGKRHPHQHRPQTCGMKARTA